MIARSKLWKINTILRGIGEQVIISFIKYLPTLLSLAARLAGPQARKQWELGKTCYVLIPWLGDAFDKKHGVRGAQRSWRSEAVHTGADPSDVQHVSDEVEDAMERPRFCARGLVRRAGGMHIRFPHSCSRRTRNSGCDRLPPITQCKVTRAQWKPWTSANSAASKSRACYSEGSRRPRCRKLRARVERPTPIFHEC